MMTEDLSTERLLFMLKKLSLNLTAQLELNLKAQSITGIQVYLLVYILRHHPDGTYLTQLCREIGVSKPTLSALIKKLRERGYLYFLTDPDDVRKKKVLPTEKLLTEGSQFVQKAEQVEDKIFGMLDAEEKNQLWNVEQKLMSQFEETEHSEQNEKKEVYLP